MHDVNRVVAEVPVRGTKTDRWLSRITRQYIVRPENEFALRRSIKKRVVLVHPAVNADFMPLRDDATGLVRVDQGTDCGHEERRTDSSARENIQDSRYADPATEFAPGKAADSAAPATEFVGLMIAVERQRDGALRAAGPGRRL